MVDIIIIGAGPYGLSLANYLYKENKDFLIFGKIMELWKEHTYKDMKLRSDYQTSTIMSPENDFDYLRFCEEKQIPKSEILGQVPMSLFSKYINWTVKQLNYPVEESYIKSINRDKERFILISENDEVYRAKKVIIATGIAHYLHIPSELAGKNNVIHSYHTRLIESLQEKKVLVIGSGQSAAESIAVLQKKSNQVHWYRRTDPIFYSEPLNLPLPLLHLIIKTPGIIRLLPAGLRKRLFAMFSSTTITPDYKSFLETVPTFSNPPDWNAYDIIVSATGYRYDIHKIKFLNKAIKKELLMDGNMPMLTKCFESSIPGLYFIGSIAEQDFGPAMKFMIGSSYTAQKLASVL